jgi:hypothetical protein
MNIRVHIFNVTYVFIDSLMCLERKGNMDLRENPIYSYQLDETKSLFSWLRKGWARLTLLWPATEKERQNREQRTKKWKTK